MPPESYIGLMYQPSSFMAFVITAPQPKGHPTLKPSTVARAKKPAQRFLSFHRALLSLCLVLSLTRFAQADGVCDLTLFGKLYEVFYVPPSGGIFPRFNAISEAIESETTFGKRVNAAVVGTVGGGTAGAYSKYGGQYVVDPKANASQAQSEAEDISADGKYIIGWRHDFPLLTKQPRAFVVMPGKGFQYLDELFPAVKQLADRIYPPGARQPGTPPNPYGTRGRKVNNSGMMLIESVPDPESGSRYYLVSIEGKVTPIDPERGLDLDEWGQAPLPSQLAINPAGQGLITDVNTLGYVGSRPGFIDWVGGHIDLREEILSQCDNAALKEQFADPGGSRPVYINDAMHICYGNLLLMPACPEIELQVQGVSGFELVNGKVSLRVGKRFKVRTSIRNLERGSIEALQVTPNGTAEFFKLVTPPNPPIPDRIGPTQTFVSVAEWEVLRPGEFVGNWTLTAQGSCGAVKEETAVLTIPVLPDLEKKIVVNSGADRGRKAGVDCCDTGEKLSNGDPECTLRAAIEAVNSGCASHVEFKVPGVEIPRIAPGTALPAITKPCLLDATTQSGGFVELDGAAINGRGLDVAGGDTLIRGFVIHSFGGDKGVGILLRGPGGNIITGNRLGTAVNGNAARTNSVSIGIDKCSLNQIGGDKAGDANVIGGSGIAIADGEGNRILGNRLGLGVNGVALAEASYGILLVGGSGTIVGGPGNRGNVISANIGIAIRPTTPIDGTVIEGNRIGLEASGTSVGAVARDPRIGISVFGDNTITVRNTQILNNDIAGHRLDVFLAGEGVSDCVVEKNRIGMAFGGSGALPSGLAPSRLLYGLRVDRAANVRVTDNVIAGHEWDVLISGTEQFEVDPDDGEIFLSDPDNPLDTSPDLPPVAGALIERNTIGLNSLGAVPVGTDSHTGIAVFGGAQGTVIRDNVVAGHAENEVWLSDGANHVIAGNRLGTPDGIDRGSQTGLLLDDAKYVIVGPSGVSPGNTIGWNAVAGIHVRGAATDPVIRLNQIGVDPTAQAAWPNGIGVQAGTAGEAGPATGLRLEKNVIGGNTKAGVGLTLTNETVLQGNRVGVSPVGAALPNETGVAVGGTPVQLLQNTIAHNKTVGIAIVGKEPALIQGGPIYANGTGLSFEGILYDAPPTPPSGPPVILRSTAGDSGKVTVVYVVAAAGGVGEVEIEIYGNRALESQGRTPLIRRTTPAAQALIGKIEVEPSSAFAVLETFSVTVTRDGRTSEFSEASPGLPFELSKPKLVAVSDTELTMQWSGSPLIVPEEADSPNGPWEPVTAQPVLGADGTAILTLPTDAGTKFFRLRLNL